MCVSVAPGPSAARAAAQPTRDDEGLVAEMLGWTKLSRRAIVSVEPELIAALLKPPKRDPATGALEDAVLQGEVTSDETAEAYGWRSMRVRLDVSCTTLSDRVMQMQVFPDHNAGGTGRALAPPEGWIRPSAHTYAADVIDVLCGRGGSGNLSPIPLGVIAQVSPPAPPRAPVPAETPMAVVRDPARHGLQPPRSTPRTPAGAALAQLAAMGSQVGADELLTRLAARYGHALSALRTRVDPVSVQGKSYYRVVVAGFSSPAAAAAFCTVVRDLSSDCIVRRDGG